MKKNTRPFAKTKKLIVGNWKMNPETVREARKIFADIKKKRLILKKSIAVVCPPVIFLNTLSEKYSGNLKFGVQDVTWRTETESTGEISTEMVLDSKAQYAIIGHAERREVGDTNEIITEKLKKVLSDGLIPVFCVGEKERDNHGDYLRFVEKQLFDSLSKIKKSNIEKVVIAYEPLWAIGKGKRSVTPYEIHQMVIFIKKHLVSIFGKDVGMNVPILYGGSVDADNCHEIINEGMVDGLLVGRASLNPHVFTDIIKISENIK
jgi:triosephosphate isomerase